MRRTKYDILNPRDQEEEQASQELARLLENYLLPLLTYLDTLLDKRLVRTFVQCCVAILRFRNNKQGLLLSELGSFLDGYHGLSKSAPAGTKRVGNLITYVLLILGGIIILVPFVWMISTSLKTQEQLFTYPVQWIPNPAVPQIPGLNAPIQGGQPVFNPPH